MRRRSVLAAVTALAAGSGCARVLGDDPVEVRVSRVEEASAGSADDRCVLSSTFVDSHPVLERLFSSATTAPAGEWVTSGVDRETGAALAADLDAYCQTTDDVYRYDGEQYRVSVRTESGDSLLDGSGSSEAIRGLHPEDAP